MSSPIRVPADELRLLSRQAHLDPVASLAGCHRHAAPATGEQHRCQTQTEGPPGARGLPVAHLELDGLRVVLEDQDHFAAGLPREELHFPSRSRSFERAKGEEEQEVVEELSVHAHVRHAARSRHPHAHAVGRSVGQDTREAIEDRGRRNTRAGHGAAPHEGPRRREEHSTLGRNLLDLP